MHFTNHVYRVQGWRIDRPSADWQGLAFPDSVHTLLSRPDISESEGGYKANFFEVVTGDEYWISGPKRDGSDRLYGERIPIEIDEDAREAYWTDIRNLPDCIDRATA